MTTSVTTMSPQSFHQRLLRPLPVVCTISPITMATKTITPRQRFPHTIRSSSITTSITTLSAIVRKPSPPARQHQRPQRHQPRQRRPLTLCNSFRRHRCPHCRSASAPRRTAASSPTSCIRFPPKRRCRRLSALIYRTLPKSKRRRCSRPRAWLRILAVSLLDVVALRMQRSMI